ncbi:hypothetical protein GGR54DRAFT_626074 [Hypoxylon sp. NC1633]|nr:hypothetical protein GGR54DRAFT_626074 [Hypoxylon sp. NC1633]
MARHASSEQELQVSKCLRETGRKRYRVPKSTNIPFETPTVPSVVQPANVPLDDVAQDEANLDEDIDILEDENQVELQLEEDSDMDSDILEIDIDLAPPPLAVPFNADLIPLMLDEAIAAGFNELADDEQIAAALENFEVDEWNPQQEEDAAAEAEESAQDSDGAADEQVVPQIAFWRLNLTALSQLHNIYMAAYADKIHISRPRSCITNAIPTRPDLILQPKPSAAALTVGGYTDEAFPHQVNHLIVGDFGDEEILLLAYDDGDVIAYYVRQIENELVRHERDGSSNNRTKLQPFLHENVGKSAWGLAVHKNSRLIAVSSNRHHVVVFVFALTGVPYRHTSKADPVEFFRNVVRDEKGAVVDSAKDLPEPPSEAERAARIDRVERALRRRDANWRIILDTGRLGTNIPNIAFTTDSFGDADKIAAMDIDGKLWLMDLWHSENPHVTIGAIHRGRPRNLRRAQLGHFHRPRGWGVLILPESSFLPVEDPWDALGLVPLNKARHVEGAEIGSWIDISQGIYHVNNNSTIHPWVRSGNTNRFVLNPLDPRSFQIGHPWFDPDVANTTLLSLHEPLPNKSDDSHPEDCDPSDSGFETQGKSSNPKWSNPDLVLGDGSSIMRTYELDIELRSFEEGGAGIMFEKVIDQSRPANAVLPAMRMSHERLADLVHVPELSLVVAGSLCGRVALVTLTRPKESGLVFKRGFKIEAILPTRDDEDNQLRPICPLLGVAVSPVPFSGNTDLADKPLGPRRYRIMLHYYDHTILSYELSRSSAADPLSIV